MFLFLPTKDPQIKQAKKDKNHQEDVFMRWMSVFQAEEKM